MSSSGNRALLGCLLGLALALLVVGMVSGTLLRHVVQILPIVIVVALLTTRPEWGAAAATPIFVFWLLIVTLIWLFLAGVSRIANGTYTPAEVVSTVFMAAFAVVGLVRSMSLSARLRLGSRMTMFIVFAGIQFVAMLVSFSRQIANR